MLIMTHKLCVSQSSEKSSGLGWMKREEDRAEEGAHRWKAS